VNISRFFGSTNREALRQVRLALGPDALIVSNRRVNGGVEILATDPTAVPEQASRAQFSSPPPAPPVSARAAVPAAPRAQAPVDVMSAIGAMRGALENRIDELLWGNQLRRAPQAVSLFQTLLGFGFSTALLRAMLTRLPEHLSAKAAMQWTRNELVTHLPVLANEDALWKPGLALALVGPTGVGKTTTIAKLAARYVKRSGPDSLVLLTTDTYRIGAHEQLKIYGNMLRTPVHVVQDAAELRRIMADIRPDQTILIDNVGISQRDRYISEQAAMLAGAGRQVSRLLVLNASSHGDTLDEVARTYVNDGGTPLKGCIITKIDEASRLGASLDTAIRYQLPVHYVSNGQKVPENLLFLQAADLVDQALVNTQQSRALYAPTQADFAALMSLTKPAEPDSASQAADIRRKQLLPGLLAAVGESGTALEPEAVQAAVDYIDDHIASSEAYDLWRSIASGSGETPVVAGLVGALLRAVHNDVSENQYGHVLAVHDQTALGSPGALRGALRSSLLVSDDGASLVSPLQQLAFADGWQSSCGASAQAAPAPGEALLEQIQWVAQQCRNLPLVHLFDAGAGAMWRRCVSLGVTWLAQVAGGARLWVEDTATTAGAVAKTLDYRPLAGVAGGLRLRELAGLPSDEVAIWIASAPVQHVARQQTPLDLELVAVRLVRRRDGALIKTLLGVTEWSRPTLLSPEASIPEPTAAGSSAALHGLEAKAGWLLARTEIKAAMRCTARAWTLLSHHGRIESRQKRALVAVQLGMAAWEIVQSDAAASVRGTACGLIGKPGLTATTSVPALLKLFALKEMLA
jgi:flagellar biosynthesis protein FlhF